VYIVGLWAWPGDDLVLASRRFGTHAAIAFAVLAFWAWGVWVSEYRRWFLFAGCAVAGLLAMSIEKLECTGDMGIVVTPRFGQKHHDALTAHRKIQREAGAPDEISTSTHRPEDYPGYRGARRDAVVIGPPLARDWTSAPPPCLWRQPIGGGYAQFAIVANAAVTIEQRGNEEAIVCYDTLTGKERWQHSYTARFTEVMGGEGPRATPTIADGRVYSLGATGVLVCLDFVTGKLQWSIDILNGNKNVHWGMSGSPLVYDHLVVVNPGAQTDATKGRALAAYHRDTGQVVWTAGSEPAGYSSPMLATLAGRRQIVLLDGRQLAGYDAIDGAQLWSYPWETQHGINVAQPLILDENRVFISAGYGMGCTMLQISYTDNQWAAKDLWGQKRTMRCKFTSPVYHRGHIYGLDEGILASIDAETGTRNWRDGRYDHGQLLLSGNMLLVLSERGKLALVEATPDGHRQLAILDALEGPKTWNPPALADGKAYVRNAQEMACYDLADQSVTKK
jgi:outer membrane protein assembly factor BamB